MIDLFFKDCKKTLKETEAGFELRNGADSSELKEVSYFRDLGDWSLDERFGRFPREGSVFLDSLEFEGWFLSKLSEEKGKDENGSPFNWVTYGNFVLFEFGIVNGKSSLFVLENI
jgi:hypothetical protein